MTKAEVIIVGGGPAGAACAGELIKAGKDVLILDRARFPRLKLCAGWVTPRVWKMLNVPVEKYPHSVIKLNKLHYIFGKKRIPLPTRQYSIRRYEFDHWLVQRSGAPVVEHAVKTISQKDGYFVIDDQFQCRILVGAGGTNCPVFRTFFAEKRTRHPQDRIATMELEFPFAYRDKRCYLWFFENGLSGYSWYVPKGGNYLNIGIGGRQTVLRQNGQTIRQLWEQFVQKLKQQQLIEGELPPVKGYQYFLRQNGPVQLNNVYLIGDAAGLATIDMGEGIGPAIHSGILAARAIIKNKPYSVKAISRFSFRDILFWWL